jgi:hypothetical protein
MEDNDKCMHFPLPYVKGIAPNNPDADDASQRV